MMITHGKVITAVGWSGRKEREKIIINYISLKELINQQVVPIEKKTVEGLVGASLIDHFNDRQHVLIIDLDM